MEQVIFKDLGRMSYQEAWDFQTQLHHEVVERKLALRKAEPNSPASGSGLHYLLFCEHPPVYTLGKSGSMDNLLLDEPSLQQAGFEFFKINRGGDITYHGPGQIVGYPIFDLDRFFTDVHRYVRTLEEAVIHTLATYGLKGIRVEKYTGVWLEASDEKPLRKICAIGVHLSRWVTMHGFAFNINTDLSHFEHIIPCGIVDEDKAVTSLAKELGRIQDIEEVKQRLQHHFAQVFGFEFAIPVNTIE
ncbi:lipoyl(octanoyl) transferase LipB [Haliscomenobacter hydrossis]|uniref:Octanoyltransferase n=1 Tax=Haliscomenobacter hydrossis (strain ATCC 27775 / DSM 1100 / LMG 10767 / O) TaxID=760192 RepID=F4KQ30_HALH1|nr:lipoyl(octanoyl) transferase LipB [Haliscomenobacter hydrossis]AEE54191.1 Octanoyltransferase [Haliscomenobacter hydrossis DSM 1100]